MKTWVVVLIKDFDSAKERLRPALGNKSRRALARRNALLAVRAATAGDHVLVVAGGETSGAVVDRTFNAGVNVGLAIVERKEMQYLYRDDAGFVFMDTETYEQHSVPADVVP